MTDDKVIGLLKNSSDSTRFKQWLFELSNKVREEDGESKTITAWRKIIAEDHNGTPLSENAFIKRMQTFASSTEWNVVVDGKKVAIVPTTQKMTLSESYLKSISESLETLAILKDGSSSN